MKLINKKTGQMVVFGEGIVDLKSIGCKNVAEMLEAGWEDYKEPKGYWYINEFGTPTEITHTRENIYDKQRKNFGNYFSSKGEAEKAVEKLKAWKRLKDNKVHFDLARLSDENTITIFARKKGEIHKYNKELDLLFGGEK